MPGFLQSTTRKVAFAITALAVVSTGFLLSSKSNSTPPTNQILGKKGQQRQTPTLAPTLLPTKKIVVSPTTPALPTATPTPNKIFTQSVYDRYLKEKQNTLLEETAIPTSIPPPTTILIPTLLQDALSDSDEAPNRVQISSFDELDGNAYLIANDGTFLGLITSNKYDSDSIMNKYGTYGSKYSSESIFNRYGQYGGEYSSQSPFNKYTSTPPKIYLNGEFYGYLTKNKYLSSAVSTDLLIGYLQSR